MTREQVAVELLLRLARGGVTYDVRNGKVTCTPKDRMTPATIARLRQYKTEVMQLHAEWTAELQQERDAIQDE